MPRILVFLTLLMAVCSNADAREPKGPDALDEFLITVAVDFKAAELCGHISPDAYILTGANPKGYQASYWRSDCYMSVAVISKNPDLCKNVKTYVVPAEEREAAKKELSGLGLDKSLVAEFPFPDGSAYSEEGCKKEIASNREDVWGAASKVADDKLEMFMRKMGYDENALAGFPDREGLGNRDYSNAYFNLNVSGTQEMKNEFVRKAIQLARSSGR